MYYGFYLELTTVSRKSTWFTELGTTFKSASFHSQARRTSGSTNHAPSAKTKSKTWRFLGTQQEVFVKQSLTAQRATRRAQRDKPKLRLKESAHRAHSTKLHTWGFGKPRTQGCQEAQVCEDLPS